ncbi:hypothetical protein CAPTEDRAFT_209587, partial [Capitella teleta]
MLMQDFDDNWKGSCDQMDITTGTSTDESVDVVDIPSSREPIPTCTEEQFTKCIAPFLLQLQEKHMISASTLQIILKEVLHLIEVACDHQKVNLSSLVYKLELPVGICKEIESMLQFNKFLNVTEERIGTEWKRMKLYKKYLKYVAPVPIHLGIDKQNRLRMAQYTPILDTLRIMLDHNDLLSEVMHPQDQIPGIFKDARDGSYFKENKLFMEEENALQILLYFDEFEVVNPIGYAKKPHKLGAFYFTLGNMSADKRSSLQAIQLVLLVYVQDLKVYGFNKVVKPLLEDLHVLENEGVQCGPVKLRGTVIALAGDNLASHSICGFMESFSGSATSTLCRFCNGTRDMMRTNTPATQFKLRTKADYDKKVEVVSKFPDMSSMYGLKTHCVFNDLKYFHAVTGLTPDIMHDVLEVVIGYDLCLVIPRMVSE